MCVFSRKIRSYLNGRWERRRQTRGARRKTFRIPDTAADKLDGILALVSSSSRSVKANQSVHGLQSIRKSTPPGRSKIVSAKDKTAAKKNRNEKLRTTERPRTRSGCVLSWANPVANRWKSLPIAESQPNSNQERERARSLNGFLCDWNRRRSVRSPSSVDAAVPRQRRKRKMKMTKKRT